MLKERIEELKPAVKKKYLILLAGLAWLGVGIMLAKKAFHWFVEINDKILLYSLIGFTFALIFHHFGFLRIADKNIKSIEEMEGLRCIFSFIKWKSYVLILVMISFGIVIRHSSLPLQDIGIIYLTIGLSLVFSSIRYFRFFLKSE